MRTPGWFARSALVVALLLGAIVGAFPALFAAWWGSSSVVTLLTAAALERTDGLDPGTFEVSYWFTLIVTGVVLLWCGWRRLRQRPGPMLPLVALIGAYALGFVVLVIPDMRGSYDAPDGLTTLVLLGAAWLWRLVLPVTFLYLLGRGIWFALRRGWGDRRVAASVGGLALVVGLAGGQLLLGAGAAGVTDTRLDDVSPFPAPPGEVDDDLRELRVVAAAAVAPRRSSRASTAFDECAETLYRTRGKREAVFTAAMHRVSRVFKRAADAYDIAMDTLVKVCERHVKAPVKDLVKYFWKSLTNTALTACRVTGREPGVDPSTLDATVTDGAIDCGAGFRRTEAGIDLQRGWRRLSAEDHFVLRLFVEGYSYAEIAEELGITEAGARQKKKRALERLQALYQAAD
ncbi:MAG: hypothetical protein EP329_18625 [Deltaproteobacteria bacterium]|nr:MAG: hypothetical protein EP329_18625 [Deltaproteobacteria bacterium]